MESLLTLPLAGEARVRILQITDTHLFAEKHETLLGVNTWDSYQSVLDAIHADRTIHLIVATGDLARIDPLRPISILLRAWQAFVRPAFGYRAITIFSRQCTARCRTREFPWPSIFIGEQWQILLLDSQVFGVPHGELSEFQLEWLERKLADAQSVIPCCFCIIILCLRVVAGSIGTLRNAAELDNVLVKYPRVKYLLCGHIRRNWI
ncbi:metallophosphoesterase [Shigella flexneri]